MSSKKCLNRDDDLYQYECWKQIVDVHGEYINLKVLSKIADKVCEITGILPSRDQKRKKELLVQYINDSWEKTKKVVLEMKIDPEDVKQGPLAQQHKYETQNTNVAQQIPQNQVHQIPVLQIQHQQVQTPQFQVPQIILNRPQIDEAQKQSPNSRDKYYFDNDISKTPDEDMLNFFDPDFYVRSYDDIYIE